MSLVSFGIMDLKSFSEILNTPTSSVVFPCSSAFLVCVCTCEHVWRCLTRCWNCALGNCRLRTSSFRNVRSPSLTSRMCAASMGAAMSWSLTYFRLPSSVHPWQAKAIGYGQGGTGFLLEKDLGILCEDGGNERKKTKKRKGRKKRKRRCEVTWPMKNGCIDIPRRKRWHLERKDEGVYGIILELR